MVWTRPKGNIEFLIYNERISSDGVPSMNTVSAQQLKAWLNKLPDKRLLPFKIDRHKLYRVPELYAGYDPRHPESYEQTFDHRVYLWTLEKQKKNSKKKAGEKSLKPCEAVAANLHDTTITRALALHLRRSHKWIVGFMGGHDIGRDEPLFEEIARIARALQRHKFLIVSGGGPGLMEAANFGAFMAPYSDADFSCALSHLQSAPHAKEIGTWIASAAAVRKMLLGKWDAHEARDSASIGIPTWYYGSEPPNLFATHSGKYFFNSIREDGLVSIANGGIIFTPGAAGTVQEIFQDSTLNYYEIERSLPTPMILFGKRYWNPISKAQKSKGDKPVYPLLKALAEQSKPKFYRALLLTDSGKRTINFVLRFREKSRISHRLHKHHQNFKGRSKAVL